MLTPRKLLFAMIFLMMAAGLASANDIYFAQNAQGGNNGQDCADAYAYNDGSNGINASKYWVAGNTFHLCGTIVVPAGTTVITTKGSGTSSAPITIKLESGALLQAPYFGSNGAINVNGNSYITINGTDGTGTIQATLNGTSGGRVRAEPASIRWKTTAFRLVMPPV